MNEEELKILRKQQEEDEEKLKGYAYDCDKRREAVRKEERNKRLKWLNPPSREILEDE